MKPIDTQLQRGAPAPEEAGGFTALFQDYAPRLQGFFRARGASHTLAEELTQEVMVVVWNKARQFDPSRGSLSTWVFTIARNRHVDAVRRQRRPEPDPRDPCFRGGQDPQPPDELVRAAERGALLRAALLRLSPERRSTLQQMYFDGRTLAEIAQRDGVPLGTVKSRARRGLVELRAALDAVEMEDDDGQ